MRGNRLSLLPAHALPGGLRVVETTSFASRLLGLALLDDVEPYTALLIRRCSSVHTLGMMFAIDVVFLDERGRALRVATAVRPARFVSCRRARAVLETPADRAERFLAAGAGQILASINPRPPAAAAGRSARIAPAPRSR